MPDATAVVSSSKWTPLYDLRATANPAGKERSPSVQLSYRASIMQDTGEDWNNVALVLSTASPRAVTSIPNLKGQRIQQHREPARSYSLRRGGNLEPPKITRILDPHYRSAGLFEPSTVEEEKPPPAPLQVPTATAKEGTISASFHIDGLTTVASNGAAHKVAIGVLDLEASLEWIAVPALSTTAFLQVSSSRDASKQKV